jgi:hypothetical protein
MGFSQPNIGFLMAVLKRPGYPASCDIGMDQKRSYDLPYFFGMNIHCQRFFGEQIGTRVLRPIPEASGESPQDWMLNCLPGHYP